jgi:hypothetical protein
MLHQRGRSVGSVDEVCLCLDTVVLGDATSGVEPAARSRLAGSRLSVRAAAHDVGHGDKGDATGPGEADRLFDGDGRSATAVDAADDVLQGHDGSSLGGR